MAHLDEVREGLQLFERQAWASAHAALAGADERAPLACDQLEVLAAAAYLAGFDDASDRAWTRAFHLHQRDDDPRRAVRCAFWLAFRLLNAGDVPQSSGWVARIRRLLERCPDSVEQGYGSYVYALQFIFGGDASGAEPEFAAAAELGARFGDADLVTLARVGQGRSLIYLGEAGRGLALLDEAMVAVTAGEVSPVIVGDAYCSVIEACTELFDLRRVQAWTSGLSSWCDAQPELVTFRGQCMVHRSEALQLRGDWPAALAEARRACAQLSTPVERPAVGAAHYQEGELHRLRGEFAAAEAAYRRASAAGRDPQPGLALLRLAEGNIGAAATSIRRAVSETAGAIPRARLLPAYAEISLAADDVHGARGAAGELADTAAVLRAPLLRALAATTDGRVLLARGAAQSALGRLRMAASLWIELGAPYEAARVRVEIGAACHALGDADGAELEADSARAAFGQLGAAPDAARLQPSGSANVLSTRETEVIRLIATGESNRQIASALVISERTVERHVSNIFGKLGITSRAAATAYVYEHRLL
jgi:DNA-binding CsgD family transcriptional regulator